MGDGRITGGVEAAELDAYDSACARMRAISSRTSRSEVSETMSRTLSRIVEVTAAAMAAIEAEIEDVEEMKRGETSLHRLGGPGVRLRSGGAATQSQQQRCRERAGRDGGHA
jgi:hypothetical protein